jgi:hypothetical protein
VAVIIAVGVNSDGRREVLGMTVGSVPAKRSPAQRGAGMLYEHRKTPPIFAGGACRNRGARRG